MLLSFQVTNHKSIRSAQTLHLEPVYDKSQPVLPVAAIFGANAAGKSNVLDALRFMVDAARNSIGSWRNKPPYQPFRLGSGSDAVESVYEVDLMLEGVRWTYGFAIDAALVRREWLYSYPHQRRRTVFERTPEKLTFGSANRSPHRAMLAAISDLLGGSLLISVVLASGAGLLSDALPVARWFENGIDLMPAGGIAVDEVSLIERLENAGQSSALVSLVAAADVGIDTVAVEQLVSLREPDVADKGDATDGPVEKRLFFLHGPHRTRMVLAEQSHGTKVWLSFLGPVLDALGTGTVLVIDEIDTSLHPRLSAQLIALFRDVETNPRGAQLVFTTHDATLLGRQFGEDVLARDEIWFVEKDRDGVTSLYALADFKPRFDENTQRRYLTGSYGAVPMLLDGDFREAIRELHHGDGRAAS